MNKTRNDRVGEPAEIRRQFKREQIDVKTGRRTELLGEKLADQALVRPRPWGQMSGMGLVLQTRFATDVILGFMSVMVERSDKNHRQGNRQHNKRIYAPFQRHV